MSQIDDKLSHIIINVNKITPKGPILSFCTNIENENDKIRFTYLCYDNQIPDNDTEVLVELLNTTLENRRSLFIITDSVAVTEYADEMKTACVVINTGTSRGKTFPKVLYFIEDIEYITLSRITKMWERYHGIPWTIATTKRLVIREQTIGDIEALYEIYSDKEVTKYTEDLFEDPEEERAYLHDYIEKQYRFYEFGIWALTLKDDGRLIGRAGISVREGFDIPEVGYVVGKKYQRCGYAGEALAAIIEYAEEELGLDRLIAFTKEKNIPSVRLLRSLGFSKCGKEIIRGGKHAMYILTKQR